MTTKNEINQHINAVMDTLGWPKDAFIPIANEENRQLMEQMQNMLNAKEQKCKLYEQLQERVKWLEEHHKNAEADIQQNLKLIDAHRRHFESEHHMCKIAENDQATASKLLRDLQKESNELQNHEGSIETEMLKLNEKIDNMGSDMLWMKHALIEWTRAMDEGDQTNALIEKYCKDDQKRADALETRRKAIQTNILRNSTLLANLCEEEKSLEQILERSAQLYRHTHFERNQMVKMWREAVIAMNARDTTIRETVDKITIVREQTARKTTELQEQIEFLNQQINNNKESELSIENLNHETAGIRLRLAQIHDDVQLKSNELITAKRLLQNQSNHLQQIRQKNRQAIIEREAKTKAIDELKTITTELNEKLKKFSNKRGNAQDRLKHLDELVEAEEKSLANVELEMSRLSQMLYRSQQILQQWQNENKLVETQIQVLETTIKAITGNFVAQEKELNRQNEIQYDIHFKILTLESRIAKMHGTTAEVNPDTIEKLRCLEKIYEIVQKKREHVRQQVTTVEVNERKLTIQLSKNNVEHVKLTEKLRDCQLNCENGIKKLGQRRNENQELLVEHSLLKMRVHQMQSMFGKQMEKFFDLEEHKFQLQLAIDERMLDIKCQLDLLNMQRKHLCDERYQLRADIGERKLKIVALRTRYELANELMGKNEDGTIISAVQLKIEMAQENETLLREGSELNAKVIMAEKDVKALESTLILLNYSNDEYKKTMGQMPDDDESNKLIKSFNVEHTKAINKLKNSKANLQVKIKMINDLQKKYSEYEKELDDIIRVRLESNDSLMKVHKEIFEQKSKLERAERELKIARKAMVQKIGDRDYIRIFEKDLTAKELEGRNATALQQLANMVDTVSGMGPVVTKHLYEKGLQMPVQSTAAISTRQQPSTSSQNLSRTSFRSSGRESEYSFNLDSRDQDGIISRMSHQTFSSTSSTMSSDGRSTKSEQNKNGAGPSVLTLDFHVDGQTIRSEKSQNTSKNIKSKK